MSRIYNTLTFPPFRDSFQLYAEIDVFSLKT